MSRGLSSTLTHGHQVPRCSATSNGRPHPLFIEDGPKLAVTLKPRENRVFADCPPHSDRTVRHSKPTARNAINTCQSRPLQLLLDCPLPRGGPSAVQTPRTLRETTSLTKSGSDWRTVRSPGADCPPFNPCATPETAEFLSKNFHQVADRPPPRAGPYAGQLEQHPVIRIV